MILHVNDLLSIIHTFVVKRRIELLLLKLDITYLIIRKR